VKHKTKHEAKNTKMAIAAFPERINCLLNTPIGWKVIWRKCLECPAEWDDLLEPITQYPIINKLQPAHFGIVAKAVSPDKATVKSLKPKQEILDMIPDIPKGTTGYHILSTADYNDFVDCIVDSPDIFIASDSQEILDRFPLAMKVEGPRPKTQTLESVKTAVADWQALRMCKSVEICYPSTFTHILSYDKN